MIFYGCSGVLRFLFYMCREKILREKVVFDKEVQSLASQVGLGQDHGSETLEKANAVQCRPY